MKSHDDPSGGWEAIASDFMASRSAIGREVVRQWARNLPPGGDVVDIGCGSGVPVSVTLAEDDFKIFGIDASPTLLAAFRLRFPQSQTACEAVQDSPFFHRCFDGVVAVGLMFLLSEYDQQKLIDQVAKALKPGGRFLFSAPRNRCEWKDLQTGKLSLSLGEEEYERLLSNAGMRLMNKYVDEGDNHYYDAAA